MFCLATKHNYYDVIYDRPMAELACFSVSLIRIEYDLYFVETARSCTEPTRIFQPVQNRLLELNFRYRPTLVHCQLCVPGGLRDQGVVAPSDIKMVGLETCADKNCNLCNLTELLQFNAIAV